MIVIDERKLKKSHKTAAIIAVAMMFTLLIYGLLGELFLKKIFPEPLSSYSILLLVLIVIAAVEIVMIIVSRNIILSGKFNLTGENQESANDNSHVQEDSFIRRLYSSFIVAYAICETIAIYGLILYVTGKDPSVFYGFLGAALFLMIVQFPKYEEWENRLKDFLSD